MFFPALYVGLCRDVLGQQFVRSLRVFFADQKLDTADQVRVEPIQPDNIVIEQEALYASRVQNAFCD